MSARKLTAGSQRDSVIAATLLCAAIALAATRADATAVSQRDPVEVARTIVRQHLPAADTADISTFVIAEALDPRLRLSACHEVPSGRLESNAITRGRALVRVSCRAPVSWNVFVPVRIESEAAVRVLTRSLPRGATVAPADAALQQRRFLGLSENYVKSEQALTGYRLRRPMAAGDVLTRDALEPAPLVLRGSQVTLRAESSGFRIESSGRALADAAAGQRVRVQHAESLKVVEGVVDNVGIVRIGP